MTFASTGLTLPALESFAMGNAKVLLSLEIRFTNFLWNDMLMVLGRDANN
jgi:hypothetical protein